MILIPVNKKISQIKITTFSHPAGADMQKQFSLVFERFVVVVVV
jgi:hypothetical protein